jgi:hypothetical protein
MCIKQLYYYLKNFLYLNTTLFLKNNIYIYINAIVGYICYLEISWLVKFPVFLHGLRTEKSQEC